MKKATRKKIHQALVNAVPRLAGGGVEDKDRRWHWDSKDEYICHAIESADDKITDGRYYGLSSGAKAATAMIAKRLYPSSSLDGWLEKSQGIPEKDITWKNMQTHRHAWLQMLIKEFSK